MQSYTFNIHCTQGIVSLTSSQKKKKAWHYLATVPKHMTSYRYKVRWRTKDRFSWFCKGFLSISQHRRIFSLSIQFINNAYHNWNVVYQYFLCKKRNFVCRAVDLCSWAMIWTFPSPSERFEDRWALWWTSVNGHIRVNAHPLILKFSNLIALGAYAVVYGIYNFWAKALRMTILVFRAMLSMSRTSIVPFILTYDLDISRSWLSQNHCLERISVTYGQNFAKF